jgi:hypothetical protein
VGGGANGVIVMIIGGWLLLNTLGSAGRLWELFWPIVLIGIGTMLVMQTLRRAPGTRPASTPTIRSTSSRS